MTGFFYDIRGLLNAKYSGRYLALLLRELGRREPELFVRVFKIPDQVGTALRKGELQVEHEWHFETKQGKKRRADLVVLKGGEPILLVEVKEDDIKSPGNVEQYADYISMLPAASDRSKREVHFVHVSRYSLPPEGQAALQKAKKAGKSVNCMRYRKIYEALQGGRGEIGHMLREYLEDIMVASYSAIDLAPEKDGKSLAFLLTQMLGFPDRTGLGRLNTGAAIAAVPSLFKILFGNLEVLADWIKERNQKIFHARFTRSFRPFPEFNLLALKNAIGDATGVDTLPGKYGQYIPSGTVIFYASGRFRNASLSNASLYVEIGYKFHIATNESEIQPVRPQLFAHFYDYRTDFEGYAETEYLGSFPTEIEALQKLHRCVTDARCKALKSLRGPCREVVQEFTVPPM